GQDASVRIARQHVRQPLPSTARLALRGLHPAIFAEADSRMIDEAVTPLIISRQVDNQSMVDAVLAARAIANELTEGTDYMANERQREIQLTPAGLARIAEEVRLKEYTMLGHPYWRREMIETALRAEHFFKRDKHYVVKDDTVIIV